MPLNKPRRHDGRWSNWQRSSPKRAAGPTQLPVLVSLKESVEARNPIAYRTALERLEGLQQSRALLTREMA